MPRHLHLTRVACALALCLAACRSSVAVPLPDVDLARSSDGQVAFVRATPDHLVSTSLGDEQASELWIANADGTRARRLLTGASADSAERTLAAFSSPQFSPDGRRLYFLSRAWVTSDAVHGVDVATGREWFVAPGNSLAIIPRGPLAGCLLVDQHRHRPNGGSYDWTWLLASDGREIAPAATDSGDRDRTVALWMSGRIPDGALAASRAASADVRCTGDTVPHAPLVDYHQHLISPAFAPIVKLPARDGRALLAELDSAGIGRAVVLSVGYSFADERKKLDDPDGLTRAENDWTSGQVASSGGRLIGFCSANPLRPAALAELQRCLALPGMIGVKVHFGNSGISLREPAHAARMVELFSLAERLHAPVLVHMRARGGLNFGAEDARLFLDKLVTAAPSIEIVVAHLGGAGPGFPPQADELMAVFAAAVERGDSRMRNIYFDVATVVTAESTPEEAALVAKRIRQVGAQRVLYGSDGAPPGGSVRAGWEIFRTRTPLTAAELETIAGNLTRFAR